MKTRQGFVSNSSTTSFCIFGISIGNDKSTEEIRNKIRKKWTLLDIEDNCEDDDSHQCDAGFVAGIAAQKLPKNKTLDQVAIELKKLFTAMGCVDPEIKWHAGAWRDG